MAVRHPFALYFPVEFCGFVCGSRAWLLLFPGMDPLRCTPAALGMQPFGGASAGERGLGSWLYLSQQLGLCGQVATR